MQNLTQKVQVNFVEKVIDFRHLGEIRDSLSGKCLDAVGRETPPAVRDCHGLGGYQALMYSAAWEIRTATRCLSPGFIKVRLSSSKGKTTQ